MRIRPRLRLRRRSRQPDPDGESGPTDALVADLSERIDRILAELLRKERDVALVNFPNHGNPGDPAIWLGTLAALDRASRRIRYQASWSSYDPDALRAAHPEGPILLQGGGNFGDRHRGQQETRERVLEDFPGRPVLQLPQSIEFRQVANLDRMRRLCRRHGAFTVLTRDAPSRSFAARELPVVSDLCPDMALALGPLDRVRPPEVDVVWLTRTDDESSGVEAPVVDDVRVLDWWPEPQTGLPLRVWTLQETNRRLVEHLRAHPGSRRWRALAATFAPLARFWMGLGVRTLCEGKVVVTDRLHGHLLSLLLGIPHVLLDNANGKVRATYETFTFASDLAHWADSPTEALDKARELAR